MLNVIFLSIIQGITEFLPISSSAHLSIYQKFFSSASTADYLLIYGALHLGSLIALMFYYKRETGGMILDSLKGKFKHSLVGKMIVSFFAFVPFAIIMYFVLDKFNINDNSMIGTYVMIAMAAIFGVVLFAADKNKAKKHIDELTFREAISIGLYQIISIIPGVSRSGITITRARMLGYTREDSLTISMLLGIPTVAALGAATFVEVIARNSFGLTCMYLEAIFFSMIFSYLSLVVFVKFLRKNTFTPFVIYRILFSIVLLVLIFSGSIKGGIGIKKPAKNEQKIEKVMPVVAPVVVTAPATVNSAEPVVIPTDGNSAVVEPAAATVTTPTVAPAENENNINNLVNSPEEMEQIKRGIR